MASGAKEAMQKEVVNEVYLRMCPGPREGDIGTVIRLIVKQGFIVRGIVVE